MFKRLATSLGLASPDPPPASVIAQMGKTQFKVEFEPEQDFDDPEKGAKVGFLKIKIAEATNQSSDKITLVHGGRKLLDNEQYLLDCGVKTDAKILVILSSGKNNNSSSSNAKKARKVKIKAKEEPKKPVKTGNERVQEVADTGKELETLVSKFENQNSNELTLEKTKEEHHKLSEVVLQKMFALDDVDVADDSDLRKFRKDTINSMHQLHKRVDVAFEKKKSELTGEVQGVQKEDQEGEHGEQKEDNNNNNSNDSTVENKDNE